MANDEHVAQLKKGVAAWNEWRKENPDIRPDLSKADFRSADLCGANLREANLREANLSMANLSEAILIDAILREANLSEAILNRADLRGANLLEAALARADLYKALMGGARLWRANLLGANLSEAVLARADLHETNLGRAVLTRAYLENATLVGTDLMGADLTGCHIYGVSAWGLKLDRSKQQNLVITRENEPQITVDNIEVAQFVYLLLNNPKIRDVIDTIGKKAVLILGRFTPERKAVLDALREELRKRDYVPILFRLRQARQSGPHWYDLNLGSLGALYHRRPDRPKQHPI